MKKKLDSKRALRDLVIDRGHLNRFPAFRIDPVDPPCLFPLVEGFEIVSNQPIDIVWIDQHGILTFMDLVSETTRPAGPSLLDRLLACAGKIEAGELLDSSVIRAAAENDWKEEAKPGWNASPVDGLPPLWNNAFPRHASVEPAFTDLEMPLSRHFRRWLLSRFWELVEQNLERKNYRLIVTADRMPPVLADKVQSLRREGKNIYGLETAVLSVGDEWNLVGIGATGRPEAPASPEKRTSAKSEPGEKKPDPGRVAAAMKAWKTRREKRNPG